MEIVPLNYDVVVVGSGGAGGAAAHAASQANARVLVVSKDPIGCSDSKIAGGIVAVRGVADENDSLEALSTNIRLAGGDLPDPRIADALSEDSQEAYEWFQRQGLRPRIDEKKNKPRALPVPLGGHSHRRSIKHDHGGLSIGHAAWNSVVQGQNIDYLEDSWFLDVVTVETKTGSVVVGGLVYDAGEGKLLAIHTRSVVIAAGGLGTMYFPNTDTMRGNTGDSYALALRSGCDLVDMEQIQFLPFCLTAPASYEGLCAGEPASAGYLGVIRDSEGKLVLDSVMLRTRAECAAAMVKAVANGRGTTRDGCYLDLSANVSGNRSGDYYKKFMEGSMALSTVRQALGRKAAECAEPWEVRPAAHYAMGGIRTDEFGRVVSAKGRPVIQGLFAAGQAMGGVFGANRLGSTSLTEAPVFGKRSGSKAADLSREQLPVSKSAVKDAFSVMERHYTSLVGRGGVETSSALIRRLQKAAWKGIGPARTEQGLIKFQTELEEVRNAATHANISSESQWNQSFIDYIELINMLDTAEAVARSAMERQSSLGAHVRLDSARKIFPFSKPHSIAIFVEKESNYMTYTINRAATSWHRLLPHLIHAQKRKIGMKILRILPLALRDRIVEGLFKSVMGEITKPNKAR